MNKQKKKSIMHLEIENETNKNFFWMKCNKRRNFVFPKVSYIFNKTLTFSNNCSNCADNNDTISE